MTRITLGIAATLALVVTLPAAPANAQTAIRTYVSITGSDSNPCSLTQPCRHFQAAVNATSVGGEVDALDPGGYGSLTISQAVTIDGEGWSYVAPPSDAAAITINTTSGSVYINGVSLNGVGVSNAYGIQFTGAGTLNIQNSVIRNFTNYGIFLQPTASSKLFVSNTQVSDNNAFGVNITLQTAINVTGTLDHVALQNNGYGLAANGYPGAVTFTISDCMVSDNVLSGIDAGENAELLIRNSTIADNGNFGVVAGQGGSIWVTRSSIYGNGVGTQGNVASFGDNNLVNNQNGNSFSSSTQYQ
jgi:hypothetical protein